MVKLSSCTLRITFAITIIMAGCTAINTSDTPPEENRFTVVELTRGLDEPMELEVLPDGKILVIERKGNVKLYDPETNSIRIINTLSVFHDLEDGLLGLAIDPKFNENRWLYLFYSPAGENPVQRISRFLFQGDSILRSSEKVVLEIPVQREECCHSAGSLEFGPDGILYIAVGDNTNPHNPGYYNSIDERPGREYWDAQRTAANSNDLRGKILRIKPEANGTYSIPDGNLFPKDGSKGKAEIFAMGCRNPYRIGVDPMNGNLLWGDVGQNTIDDPTRGPVSYDKWHFTTEPGFFGWPYFAGPNAPYTHYDYEKEEIGPFYDSLKPVNYSRNNTGIYELPPAKPALIWYSYDESQEFAHLGTGGKSPIGGPVYYSKLYPSGGMPGNKKFPSYFDGKWFIAEWMRDWINVVTVDDAGKLVNIEPFLPEVTFNHPIDLQFGPDGALYVLDYGTLWFSKNDDSRLLRIEYEKGNRKPIAVLQASDSVGAVPLTINFSSEGTFDHDKNDKLTFAWNFGEGLESSADPSPVFTYHDPGVYTVSLKVRDGAGATAEKSLRIVAGNSRPEIDLHTEGNKSFYWDNRKLKYSLSVTDAEDGSLGLDIPADSVRLTAVYGRTDGLLSSSGTQSAGLELILNSDCRSCHALKDQSVGPAYFEIAERYTADAQTIERLARTIIHGGSGNWGTQIMSAHPQLSTDQVTDMVKYILSLSSSREDSLPHKGEYIFRHHTANADEQRPYEFIARYKDRGNPPVPPYEEEKKWVFRPTKVKASGCDNFFASNIRAGIVYMLEDSAFIAFHDLHLTDVKSLTIRAGSSGPQGRIEIRSRSPGGRLLGMIKFLPEGIQESALEVRWTEETVELTEASGTADLYFVYYDEGKKATRFRPFYLDWIVFGF